ncbi:MAG: hypothetical protein IKA58_00345, partial [Clostridia bacterium]|nr:hypothetical protein [Clostridia bacterium]
MEVKKDILTIEEQQAKLLKKMRRMDMIRTLACVLVAVVAVGIAVTLVPRVNTMLDQANTALTELTAVTEDLNKIDFEGMSEGINTLTAVGAESILAAAGEMTETMHNMQKIDFDALAESIENFNAISTKMARL